MNRKIIRIKGKKLCLPEAFRFNAVRHRFYETVDYRCPHAGEWFVSGAIPQAYRAENDLSNEYLIVLPCEHAKQILTYVKQF